MSSMSTGVLQEVATRCECLYCYEVFNNERKPLIICHAHRVCMVCFKERYERLNHPKKCDTCNTKFDFTSGNPEAVDIVLLNIALALFPSISQKTDQTQENLPTCSSSELQFEPQQPCSSSSIVPSAPPQVQLDNFDPPAKTKKAAPIQEEMYDPIESDARSFLGTPWPENSLLHPKLPTMGKIDYLYSHNPSLCAKVLEKMYQRVSDYETNVISVPGKLSKKSPIHTDFIILLSTIANQKGLTQAVPITICAQADLLRLGFINQSTNRPDIIAAYYLNSATLGYFPPAMVKTGNRYEESSNFAEAFRWYEGAHALNYIEAAYWLGVAYLKGRGVRQDKARGIELIEQAAKVGYAKAQCRLGRCYERGYGVDKNPAEAAQWYLAAADQHFPQGLYEAGRCYTKGIGVEIDSVAAKVYNMLAKAEGYIK